MIVAKLVSVWTRARRTQRPTAMATGNTSVVPNTSGWLRLSSPAGDGLQHEEPVAGLEGHIVIHDRRDVVVVVEEEQMLPQAHRLVVKMGTQPRIGVQLLK